MNKVELIMENYLAILTYYVVFVLANHVLINIICNIFCSCSKLIMRIVLFVYSGYITYYYCCFIFVFVFFFCCCAVCACCVFALESACEMQAIKIRVGDEVRVVTTNRDRMTFEVTQILDDRFTGVTVEPNAKELRPAGVEVEVSYDSVAMVQITRFDSKAATAAAIGGVIMVTVALGTLVLTGVPVIIPP